MSWLKFQKNKLMESNELIVVEVFCKESQIEISLINELEEFGLIEIVQNNGLKYIHLNHLNKVEKVIRFHNELNINKEGIEAIFELLKRLEQLNEEVQYLKNKLKLYE